MSLRSPLVHAEALSAILVAATLGFVVYLGSHSASLTVATVSIATISGISRMAWFLRLQTDARNKLTNCEALNSAAFNPFAQVVQDSRVVLNRWHREVQESESQQVQLRTRLNNQKRSLDQIMSAVDAVALPVLLAERTGRIIHGNEAARGLAERLNGSLTQTPTIGDFPELESLICEAISSVSEAVFWQREFRWTSHEKQTLEYEVHVRACENAGHHVGFSVLLIDRAELSEQKARIAGFVSSVSHEFKTPLACIRAFTEMLQDGVFQTADEQEEACETIQDQVEGLTELVNSLVNLTRIESGAVETQWENCALQEVVAAQVDAIQDRVSQKKVVLELSVSDLYLPVHVERSLIGQSVSQLLSNAIEHTSAGGTIKISCDERNGRGTITISDDGKGIPADALERVFDPFYRVPGDELNQCGNGLGLTLVQHVVSELHNGCVSATSELGQGSVFTIEIPLGHLTASPSRQSQDSNNGLNCVSSNRQLTSSAYV